MPIKLDQTVCLGDSESFWPKQYFNNAQSPDGRSFQPSYKKEHSSRSFLLLNIFYSLKSLCLFKASKLYEQWQLRECSLIRTHVILCNKDFSRSGSAALKSYTAVSKMLQMFCIFVLNSTVCTPNPRILRKIHNAEWVSITTLPSVNYKNGFN